MSTPPHQYDYPPEDDDCPMCGGTGFLEDECTCGDDTCCCLYPDPPLCPECQVAFRRMGPREP